jgi:hypothetical protein
MTWSRVSPPTSPTLAPVASWRPVRTAGPAGEKIATDAETGGPAPPVTVKIGGFRAYRGRWALISGRVEPHWP